MSSLWNRAALIAAVLLLAVGGPWLLAQVRSLPASRALAARAGERIVTLEVGGMTCGACEATVEGSLTALRGVSAVEVRRAQRRAYVVCDRTLPDSALIGAVHRGGAGFLAEVVAR
jgi:copper chaperone CopZ